MGWNTGLKYAELVDAVSKLKPDTIIRFDFGYTTPCGMHSYRGYYEDMAIGYKDDEFGNLLAGQWLDELKSFSQQKLHGYKGGTYDVRHDTTIWVSKHISEVTGTMITGIKDLGYGYAIIETAYGED